MAASPTSSRRPSREDLERARERTLTDLVRPGLRVLFCGINPGLYSAATGHHFARPGNRFWPALHRSGFTPRQLRPDEEQTMLDLGLGLTNLVKRATSNADELAAEELIAGGRALRRKLTRYEPQFVAFVGIGAYRTAFGDKRAALGRQPEPLAGSAVWVLPSPSGLNAHYGLDALAAAFAELRRAID
jgi:TDG/mug DNA glycosylase family protein